MDEQSSPSDKVVHFEIPADDLPRADKFYSFIHFLILCFKEIKYPLGLKLTKYRAIKKLIIKKEIFVKDG